MSERQSSPRVDRRLLLALAALGGVVMGLLLLGTVFGTEGQKAVGPPPRTAATALPEASGPEAAPPGAGSSSPVAVGRDPFAQIVTVPAEPPPAEQTPPAPEPAPAQPPLPAEGPGATPSVSPEAAPPPSEGSGPIAEEPVDGAVRAFLELKSIFEDGAGVRRAEIDVDGRSYTPAQGEVFSYGFRLQNLDANCAEVSGEQEQLRMCLPAAAP